MLDFPTHLAQQGRSPNTVAAYMKAMSHFAKWFEEKTSEKFLPQLLTAVDVRLYRMALVEGGAAAGTVNQRLAALRNFGEWAKGEEFIFENPALAVKGIREQTLAPRWLDAQEQARLLREAARAINAATKGYKIVNAKRNRAVLIFLLNTGLRIGEFLSLTLDDVTTGERSGAAVVRYGKGGKTRRVPLNIEARKALSDLPLPVGLSERRVQEAIAELGRRAGLEVTPHTLRHTFAKNLMDARQDITRVAALMGHANLNTTRIYTAPGERDLRQAVEALE